MMSASQIDQSGIRAEMASAAATKTPSRSEVDLVVGRVNFGDAPTVSMIGDAMRDALKSGCELDLVIDDDVWAFPGDVVTLCDALVAIAVDARLAMAGSGMLHMCVLNVFDRCGGDRDAVLLVLSFVGRRREESGDIDGTAINWFLPFADQACGQARLHRFSATLGAEFDLTRDRVSGVTISTLHPAVR